ncbi:hypothetical protein [Accumulibacter sp.]|uniref:hypothetical protein n=1 Tax=Accumulibacter sp. TaxID=2053492 RepID=UPI0025D02A25|nr:hypothetical protein [Accumulibacter sp.]MCM8594562.1 hypothetical protein [Accumulibacter sp.]MCM8627410.1 hypothetical protein [Accumulibacter sp.]MDS4048708.1 hypothetical protein [Accumulibacter sp.]
MRIPSETLPPAGKLGRELDAERRAEPVNDSTRLANDLSSAHGEAAPARPAQAAPAATGAGAAAEESPPAFVERRQTERRVENRPVLLDTRSGNRRRKGPGAGSINIKV